MAWVMSGDVVTANGAREYSMRIGSLAGTLNLRCVCGPAGGEIGCRDRAGSELCPPGCLCFICFPTLLHLPGRWPNAPGRALITSSRVLCIPCRFRQSFRNTITHCSVCCLLLPWILCSKRVQGVGLISATPAQDTVCPGIGLVRGAACPVFKGECAAPISQ